MSTDREELVIVCLRGGDVDGLRSDDVVWLDLDGSEWKALTTRDRADVVAHNSGGEIVEISAWDGSEFGDGTGGTVELLGNLLVCGTIRPTLVPRGYVLARDEQA